MIQSPAQAGGEGKSEHLLVSETEGGNGEKLYGEGGSLGGRVLRCLLMCPGQGQESAVKKTWD